MKFPATSHAFQAGCAAAILGGVSALIAGALFGAPLFALPATVGSFLATWALWAVAFRTPQAGPGRAVVVGLLCVVVSVLFMWIIFGMYQAIALRDLSVLKGSLIFAAVSLVYFGPLLLPIGAIAGYLIRKRQIS
jgi:hypothetical protein